MYLPTDSNKFYSSFSLALPLPVHNLLCILLLFLFLLFITLVLFSSYFFLNFKKIFYLFIYFWLCWVFVSVRGLSLVAASGDHSSLQCTGLSLSWPLVAEHRLQTCRLSSCGSRAQLRHGMWDLPRPGLEPVSPALAGTLSTTVPAGKPLIFLFLNNENNFQIIIFLLCFLKNLFIF